jgi:hypothetical protein
LVGGEAGVVQHLLSINLSTFASASKDLSIELLSSASQAPFCHLANLKDTERLTRAKKLFVLFFKAIVRILGVKAKRCCSEPTCARAVYVPTVRGSYVLPTLVLLAIYRTEGITMKRIKKIFKKKKNSQEGDPSPSPADEKPVAPPVEPKRIATAAPQPPRENHRTNQGSGVENEAVSKKHSEKTAAPSKGNKSIPVQAGNKPKTQQPAQVVSNGNASKPLQGTLGPETAKVPSVTPIEEPDHFDTDSNSDAIPERKTHYKGVSESFKGMTNVGFNVAELVDANHHASLGDAYDAIPMLEQIKLPRGGLSMETKAVGRVQVSCS